MITVDLEFDSQIQTADEMGKWFLFLGEKMESGFDFEQNGIRDSFHTPPLFEPNPGGLGEGRTWTMGLSLPVF